MDLIRQLNETTHQREAEVAVLVENCTLAASHAGVELPELAESIINWLGQKAEDAKSGALTTPNADNTAAMADNASELKSTAEILGMVDALTNPDISAAMNVSPDKMKKILSIAGSNHAQSDQALNWLREKGRSDAGGQTKQMVQLLQSGDGEAIAQKLTGLQQYMKKLILMPSKEEPAMESTPGSLGLLDMMATTPKI